MFEIRNLPGIADKPAQGKNLALFSDIHQLTTTNATK